MVTMPAIVRCDVEGCGKEGAKPRKLDVVFVTEQTEGRSTKPHIVASVLDVCDDCIEHAISTRQLLTASGAQGHNTYRFTRDPQ